MDQSVDLEKTATMTEGYSGADLQAVIYNAHLESVHDTLTQNTTSSPSSNLSYSSQNLPIEFVLFKNNENTRESKAEAAATAARVRFYPF